ncbi:uncharacterized protein ACMZJ9_009691 [Mantella aurantiaca]
MSRRGDGRRQLGSYRTSVEQLKKCYGVINSRKNRNTETEPVRNHTSSNSSAVTYSSLSRHEVQRLRPRTCIACRACVTETLRNAAKQTTVPKLQPLSRTNHLPYYSGKADKGRPVTRGGATETHALPDSRNLISCQFKVSRSEPGSISSKSSRHSEVKMPSPPALPLSLALPSVSSRCAGAHLSHSSDAELRKWIVEFGGDERAAFMARGLQKLQLAYEKGKSELDQNTPSAKDDCRQ